MARIPEQAARNLVGAHRADRSASMAIPVPVMPHFHPFRLDTVNQCLWRRRDSGDDERLLLPPKAYGVLRHLDRARRPAGDAGRAARRRVARYAHSARRPQEPDPAYPARSGGPSEASAVHRNAAPARVPVHRLQTATARAQKAAVQERPCAQQPGGKRASAR